MVSLIIQGAPTTFVFGKIAIDEGKLPKKYYLIGDEAFTNVDQFLSPWSGRGLPTPKDSFNYWLSHSRQCIERAFGLLTQRWGIFWRKFVFAYDRWALVVLACMKLHNWCMDKKDSVPLMRELEDQRKGDEWLVITNEQDNDYLFRDRPTGDRRKNITQMLDDYGIIRPVPKR